jgi:hypothetical protein
LECWNTGRMGKWVLGKWFVGKIPFDMEGVNIK